MYIFRLMNGRDWPFVNLCHWMCFFKKELRALETSKTIWKNIFFPPRLCVCKFLSVFIPPSCITLDFFFFRDANKRFGEQKMLRPAPKGWCICHCNRGGSTRVIKGRWSISEFDRVPEQPLYPLHLLVRPDLPAIRFWSPRLKWVEPIRFSLWIR